METITPVIMGLAWPFRNSNPVYHETVIHSIVRDERQNERTTAGAKAISNCRAIFAIPWTDTNVRIRSRRDSLRQTWEMYCPARQHTRHEKIDVAEIVFGNLSLSILAVKQEVM
jgi:hypothetical protein